MTVVAVTGASGTVGRALVPLLIQAGFEPLLVGRDRRALQSLFPHQTVCDNAELEVRLGGCQALLHLATINNDDNLSSLEEFRKVNVEWPVALAKQARDAGVNRFIYFSSNHAIEHSNESNYAVSKREASTLLNQIDGIGISEIVAPKIYDNQRSPLIAWLWKGLAAIRPTVSTSRITMVVAEEVMEESRRNRSRLISKEERRPRLYSVFTAVLDIGFAVCILVFFGWLLLLVSLAIRIDSPGPALFRQVRVGKDKKEVVCWKFRTMHADSAQRPTHEMNSSSITRLGTILRRTKVDELPQVVNLLRRELALVGPRPCLPNQTELIKERDSRGVYNVRPGITGYAQVNDIDMSVPETLAIWDERYLAMRSVLFDLKILRATFLGGGRGDRVTA